VEVHCKVKMKRLLKSNKKGGIVAGTIFGIGFLIIATITILVIVQTLNDANLFTTDAGTSTIVNRTTGVAVNEEPVNFGAWNETSPTCTIVNVINSTDGGEITAGNYSQVGCTIAFASTDADDVALWNNTVWNVSTTNVYRVDSTEQSAVDNMTSNFTTGLGNVSSKIPTILTIVAVVFLLGALVLLVKQSRQMDLGGGGSL